MSFDWIILAAILNAVISLSLAAAVLVRERKSVPRSSFAALMLLMGLQAIGNGLCLLADTAERSIFWQRASLIVASGLPAAWLFFSLTYSRGNATEFLHRWRPLLIAFFIVPILLSTVFNESLFAFSLRKDADWFFELGWSGAALQAVFLVASALVLMNLERTFRTATGTMRWRIKYLILGCGVLLGVRIYASSQAILFHGFTLSSVQIEVVARTIGLSLISFSLLRGRLAEVDIYPSHAFLYRSLTATLAGFYLLIVGLMAKFAVAFGVHENLPLQALIALLGVVGLAILLMSDRLRQSLQLLVSRHLRRPVHNYRSIWMLFAERTATLVTRQDLCREVAKLVSETFNILSVTVFLYDDTKRQLTFGASTSLPEQTARELLLAKGDLASAIDWRNVSDPVDLDTSDAPWVLALQQLIPHHFQKGGNRVLVPLVASGQFLGIIALTDRVAGVAYSTEDFDLLKCVGSQTAASLLNIKLSESLLRSKELEAFQTMSTFFVHDLKNTALMLSLMLKNLPVHFNNPEFREDSLRSIAKTIDRINDLISRLSLLREGLKIAPAEADLNSVVSNTLSSLRNLPGATLTESLEPVPKIKIDSDQIQKVLTNLVLNARDAVGPETGGRINISTRQQNGWAVLQVTDNGAGISPEFLNQSLFRPFQTTKKKGIGIGMYQSKMIVEAHSGRIEVESEPGKGATFRVLLPITGSSSEKVK